MIRIFFSILLFIGSNGAISSETTGYRNITDMGCHNVDATCYISLDGNPVTGGGPSCVSNSLRWSTATVWGKNWLALIMSAKAQGKMITFFVSSCYSSQAAYPTFDYGSIQN